MERRARTPTTPIVQLETHGAAVRARAEAGSQRSKKRTSPGETERIVTAWANGKKWQHRKAAKQIIEAAGHKRPSQLTQQDAEAAAKLTEPDYSVRTKYLITVQIRRAWSQLERAGAERIQLKARRPKPRSIAPTPEELKRLKSAAQPWERAWIILQAECGLRISEAFAAAEANHNPQNRTITIVAKGEKPRVIPTTDELEQLFAIAPAAEATTPLIDRLRGKAIKPQGRWDHWKKFLARAGVRSELNPHDLRRSAALRLYEKSRDLRAVQRMLGHDSLTSTLQYLEHYEPENLRPLIEALRIPTEAIQ